jgi:hypothetical protein
MLQKYLLIAFGAAPQVPGNSEVLNKVVWIGRLLSFC